LTRRVKLLLQAEHAGGSRSDRSASLAQVGLKISTIARIIRLDLRDQRLILHLKDDLDLSIACVAAPCSC